MITDQDVEKLKETFVTKVELKDELKEMESRLTKKFDKTLTNRLSGMERRLTKTMNVIIGTFDKLTINHGKRLDRLEKHVGLAELD